MNIMCGVLGRTFAHVGHVAIGAGDTRVVVSGSGCEELIFGLLGLEHKCASLGIFPILEASFFVVLVDRVNVSAAGPGEGQVFAFTVKVIFHMAVCTHDGTHLLAGEGCPILALCRKRFFQSRVSNDQAHGPGFMAIGATNGLRNELAQFRVRFHRGDLDQVLEGTLLRGLVLHEHQHADQGNS